MQDENKKIDELKRSRLRPPTAIKRSIPCFESNAKISKLAVGSQNLPRKEPSILRGTTFTIPEKKVEKNEKPTVRPGPIAQKTNTAASRKINVTAPTKPNELKKKPTWDLRGRIQDLEKAYKEQMEQSSQKISKLESECEELRDDLEISTNKINDLLNSNDLLTNENNDLSKSVINFTEECTNLKNETKNYVNKINELETCNATIVNEKSELQISLQNLKEKLSRLEDEFDLINKELIEAKRALDDVNASCLDKETKIVQLNNNLKDNLLERDKLSIELESIRHNLRTTFTELNNKNRLVSDLEKKWENLSQNFEEKCKTYENLDIQYTNLKDEIKKTLESLNQGERRLLELEHENEQLKRRNSEYLNKFTIMDLQIRELTGVREMLSSDLLSNGDELANLKKELIFCKRELGKSDIERRQLHHRIMELRGTIRVCCRVRPVLPKENEMQTYCSDYNLLDSTMTIYSRNLRENVTGTKVDSTKYDFNFDRLFGPSCNQQEIFDEIDPLIQSALDGYSVCVFAYGQTGSGKTYTMEGDFTNPSNVGLIQRSVDKIFNSIPLMKCKGWEYIVTASFFEIYNENIRDLLVNNSSKSISNKLEVKMVNHLTEKQLKKNAITDNSDIFISNLTLVEVDNCNKLKELLTVADRNRTVASTKCNENSSRSHSVFRLKLNGKNNALGETCEAFVNLIDLAGSERLDKSEAEGERMKETQFINKSLHCLKSVITSLAQKESHIPFRNSKLTHILQSSLGGNCKTLMFVNIAPLEDSFQESLSSLRFATNVNKCYI
ncbi:hypothetical protein HZS_4555, partial [Henneguya salminicola]